MLQIFIMMKNKTVTEGMAWWTTVLFSIYDPINSGNIINHWQKSNPKPGQTLHYVSLKAASIHSSIYLQSFFSHIVNFGLQMNEVGIPMELPDPCRIYFSLLKKKLLISFRIFLGLPVLFFYPCPFYKQVWIPHIYYPVCLLMSFWERPCWCILILCQTAWSLAFRVEWCNETLLV